MTTHTYDPAPAFVRTPEDSAPTPMRLRWWSGRCGALRITPTKLSLKRWPTASEERRNE